MVALAVTLPPLTLIANLRLFCAESVQSFDLILNFETTFKKVEFIS